MSHIWHGAELTTVNQQIPLSVRSIQELEKIRDEKAALFQHLELEKFHLTQTSDLAKRIEMLEGAIDVAENGDSMNPQERTEFLRRFVEDLRDDHHKHLAVHDLGAQAEMLPHGVHLAVAEHPILTEHRAQADIEEYRRKHPSEEEPHPDIGRPGYHAENFKLVANPWNEKGFDYTKEVAGQTPFHEWQDTLDEMEEFDKRVAESYPGQVIAKLGENISNSVPTFVTEVFGSSKEAEQPIQYGCGDVYIDRDRAKSTGRAMRWQMAEAGLPVYGDAPPVTMDWLKENKIIKADDEDEEEEKEEAPAPPPRPAPKALNYGSFEPQTLMASQMMRPPTTMVPRTMPMQYARRDEDED